MKKSIYILTFSLLLTLIACSGRNEKASSAKNEISKSDSIELAKQLYYNSLLKKETSSKGNFIDYKFIPASNEKYQIIWGNGNFTSLLPDTFKGTNPANVPALIKDTLDYLILHCDCGTECTIDIFLNTVNPTLYGNFMDLQDYDINKGIFVYRDFTQGEGIAAVNIKTKKRFYESVDKYLAPDSRAIFDEIVYKNGFLEYDLNKSCCIAGKRISKKIKLNI